MKQTTLAALLTVALIACTKSDTITETKKENYFIRVAAPSGITVDYSNVAIVKAVNGGQYEENAFGKLEYAGYSSGHYVLTITNKQTCGIDFRVEWLGKDTTIYVTGSAVKTIHLPGAAKGNEKLKCKPMYQCGSSGGDMGWLEVISPESLPVIFKYITAQNAGNGSITVSFEVSEASGVDVYWIQISKDGISYVNVAMVESDKVILDHIYSITIPNYITQYKLNKIN